MDAERTGIPPLDDDPVIRLLLRGEARTLDEAEEMYLDASMAEVLRLFDSPLTEEELCNHPLLALLRAHGSRGREDSLP